MSVAAPAPTDVDAWAELIDGWRRDPPRFVYETFDARPWIEQRRIMMDLVERDRVAVKAGHGVGKTATFAWMVWWQLVCYDDSLIPCTAPTAHQLYDVLWAEIIRWRRQMPAWLRERFKATNDRVYAVEAKETWFAVARTARPEAPEGLQGFHVNRPYRLLVCLEEASGIPEPIYQVLEGALTTHGARALMMGNPTRASGYFFDTFRSAREQWACHTLSCTEAPARIVSPAYAEGIARRFGTDSNVYRVRVLGLFPRSDDDAVVPLEWAEAALDRDLPDGYFFRSKFRVVLSLDVARFGGDDTALIARQGRAVIGAWLWHGNDTAETTAKVQLMADRIHRYSAEFAEDGRQIREPYRPTIVVDSAGIGGGVVDQLRAIRDEHGQRVYQVHEINAGESASDGEFERKRDELWWGARLFFEHEGPVIAPPPVAATRAGLTDWTPLDPRIDREVRERLTAELSTPKYVITRAGRIRVETKDEVKKRLGEDGGHSPDVADALMLGLGFRSLKPEPNVAMRWQESQEPKGWKERM